MPSAGVAVIVPAFNAQATIGATLTSVVDEPGVAEIIVIDDGSTDDTVTVAGRFAPLVSVRKIQNSGVSAARNRGIAATESPWLLFLDADDMLMPGTIAARLAASGATEADLIICDWEEMIDDGVGAPRAGLQRSIDWAAMARDADVAVASGLWATTAAILYRRDIVERIGGFRMDLPVIQDARFLFDAVHLSGRIVHAPHVGARYRVLRGSLSRRDPARFALDVLHNGRQIEAIWRANGPLSVAQRGALAGIYNEAARGLFTAGHAGYLEATAAQRALGGALPLHTRVAVPLCKAIGQDRARRLLALVGRR